MTKPPIVDPPLSGLFNAVPKGAGLLAVDEPAPFSFERLSGRAPAVLICDHASRYIPRALGTLGLDAADLARHIAWDIGAGEVVRHLAKRLDVPAVLSGFSRLAVDPNRHLQSRFSIPTDSDGTPIPGNRDLTTAARRQRIDSLFMPYHAAVSRLIEAKVASGQPPVLIFVHSFTPVMQGDERPWEAGILWDRDPRAALPLIDALRARGLAVGDNEPTPTTAPNIGPGCWSTCCSP
jgi:predicted N-formylglutamate amidohydrolase